MSKSRKNTDSIFSQVNYLFKVDSNIFAGAPNGLFLSMDHGHSWINRSTGLPNIGVSSIIKCGNDLFVGTYGGGVYRAKSSDIILEVNEIKYDKTFFTLFPNPASEEIFISNFDDSRTNIISVFNNLGVEIKRIETDNFPKNGSFVLSTSDIPVGIYYCTISNKKNRFTKSFVIMR